MSKMKTRDKIEWAIIFLYSAMLMVSSIVLAPVIGLYAVAVAPIGLILFEIVIYFKKVKSFSM